MKGLSYQNGLGNLKVGMVTTPMNNHKAIGFMLSQFRGMMMTFGQTEETLNSFINQVEQMYRIHQISEDDRNTVYQILHINRGKRNKDNLKFHTYAYEIQDVLESVDRILKEMNKAYNMEFIEGLGMSVRLTSYFECALHTQKITDEEFGYLLKMHNISKTPSKNTTNTLKR